MVSRAELEDAGVSGSSISNWAAAGRLHPVHAGVYAVGHRAIGIRGRLIAALRYAGAGAMLSHVTAAWWWGLWGTEPKRIHLSVPGRRASLPDIRVHQRRRLGSIPHRGLPVTTVPQTLLDLAATARFEDLRRALAEADYRRLLEVREILGILGRGRPGSAALRRALAVHMPELARTRSDFEVLFLFLCERHGIALPEVNVKVEGELVDAVWRHARLVVELDSREAHDTPARYGGDHDKDLTLRRGGFSIQRYTWRQLTGQEALVAADVKDGLALT